MRTSKARTGLRARLACHRRWSVYASNCRHTPEVGAVCGKAARTVLCGGRDENRVPTATAHPIFSKLGEHVGQGQGGEALELVDVDEERATLRGRGVRSAECRKPDG